MGRASGRLRRLKASGQERPYATQVVEARRPRPQGRIAQDKNGWLEFLFFQAQRLGFLFFFAAVLPFPTGFLTGTCLCI